MCLYSALETISSCGVRKTPGERAGQRPNLGVLDPDDVVQLVPFQTELVRVRVELDLRLWCGCAFEKGVVGVSCPVAVEQDRW